MHFSVRHETIYRYASPVRLGDHLLRLTPRAQGICTLRHSIEIDPAPVWREEVVDAFGTTVTRLGFDGEVSMLRIVSMFEADVIHPEGQLSALPPLPWAAHDVADFHGRGEDPAVCAFADGLMADAGGIPEGFLLKLTQLLYHRTDRRIRPSGYAQDARHTLDSRSGACRDLAVLFIAACRSQGMAARFASGYQAFAETVDGARHLHAWPEVWLPGIGWRGYDPTHGLPVSNGHIALAAAPEQAATMPVEGGYWGHATGSTLHYHLTIAAQER